MFQHPVCNNDIKMIVRQVYGLRRLYNHRLIQIRIGRHNRINIYTDYFGRLAI